MSVDEISKVLRDQPVPWDDVRERRVLTRIRAVRAFSKRRRVPWIVAGSVCAAAAAAVVLVLVFGGTPGETAGEGAAGGVVAQDEQAEQAEQPSTLELADVGQAFLHPGARVALESKTKKRVLLRQRVGKVRYEIEKQVEREVVVLASGVEVRVVGTVFTVAVEDGRVSVMVDEGAVIVRDGRRELQLGAGEDVTVAARDGVEVEREEAEEPVAEEPVDEPPPEPSIAPTRPGKIAAPEPEPEPELETIEEVEEETEEEAEEEPPAEDEKTSTLGELLEQVDEARKQGALRDASALLDRVADQFTGDPRAIAAMFTRGNVERALGNHKKAAKAYERCWTLAPKGPLAEDARAEAAACWAKAGEHDRAAEAARRYLELYPSGTHAGRMRRLAR